MDEHVNDDDPRELDASAITMHEVYASLVRAGFTEDQAFQLICIQWEAMVGTE